MTEENRTITEVRQEYERLLETDMQTALPLIRQAAHWGDLHSQILAADIYENVLPDKDQARQYTRLAALNGHAPSMMRLAAMQTSDKDALYFLKKAADAGYKPACDKLSLCYVQGKGTPKDLAMARQYNERADQNDPDVIRHKRLIELLTNK